MGLRDWIKALQPRARERPRAVVGFDACGVSCRWPDGTVQSVAWDDLRLIEIQTTDEGPFVEDVFLVLHADHAEGGSLVVPQEAGGFGELLGHLQAFPGFDTSASIAAMSCTDNATFACWRRPDS